MLVGRTKVSAVKFRRIGSSAHNMRTITGRRGKQNSPARPLRHCYHPSLCPKKCSKSYSFVLFGNYRLRTGSHLPKDSTCWDVNAQLLFAVVFPAIRFEPIVKGRIYVTKSCAEAKDKTFSDSTTMPLNAFEGLHDLFPAVVSCISTWNYKNCRLRHDSRVWRELRTCFKSIMVLWLMK